MLNKLLTFVLFLMPVILIGQINNTDKGAAIIYTKGAPTGAVRTKYDSEWAIDVNTSKVYRYDRTNSVWILAGSNIGYLNSTSAPTGAPKYSGPEFIINNDKELYWYYAGSWQCLNCGIIPYTAGTGINITGNTITNTAPDQTVVLSNGTGISVTGTYPNFTITNTAPDQTVTITGAGISNVTGTYPNFTITSTEVDGSITNEIQAIDSLILSGDTLIISLGSDGVPASRLVLSGLTAASGGGVYGPSDTVTYNHLAVIDSGLTFSTTEDTGYFNIITAPGVYGSTAYFHPDSIRLRHYDIGGSNELILNDDGILIKTNNPDRLIIQGNDARYFADYRTTYSARSLIDKQYGDDFYLQTVDTFRVSNDTLYISLARDSVPQSFVVLPSSGGGGIDLYELDIITPLPAVDVEGSMVLKTVDVNGSKYLYISNGTSWVDGGLFLDTLNVATIHLGNDQVTYAKIQEVTAERLLGNPTGSTANPSEIPLGTGLGFSAGSLINTSPDQTVVLNSGTGISVSGTYPTFTITNSSPNITTDLTFTGASSPYTLNSSDGTDVTFAQGSGITLSRVSNELTISAIDQSATNEIQTIDTFSYSSGIVTLSLSSDGQPAKTINISGVNTDNQIIDTFEIVSNILRLSIEDDGQPFKSVNLAPYLDNTDNQTLSVDSTDIGGVTERFEISISGGNTIYIDVPQVGGTGGGQNNIGANLGTGVGIYAGKTDTTLNFKSLVEGYGIDITATSTEITIKSDTAQIATLHDVAVVQADINAHELADGDLDDENELQDLVLDSVTVGNIERFELSISPAGNTIYFDVPQSSVTDLTFTGGASPYTLNSSTGTDVTFAAGTGISLSRVSNELTITSTVTDTDDQTLSLDSAIVGSLERFELSIDNGNTVYFDVPQNTDAQNLTIEGSGPTYDIAISGGTDVTIQGGGIITLSESPANTLIITGTEVDGSVTNEAWTIDATGGDTEVISNQTVLFVGAGINSTTYDAGTNTLTITGTEVDGSTTNEIQQIDTFEIVSNNLRASLLNDAVPFSSVDLSPYLDNTDDQTLTIDSAITTDGQNFILEIEDGNGVSWFVPSVGQTIYNASSSLISDRVVSLDGYTLTFEHVDGARSSTIYQDSTQVINQVITEDGEIIQSITNYQEGASATKQYLLDIDHPGTSTEVQIIAGYDNGDAEMSLTVTQGVSSSSLFLDTVGVKINTIGGTGTNGQILYSDGDYAYWDDLNITSADVITLADSVALKAYTGVATAVILKQQGREGMFVRTTTSRAHDGYMVFTDGNGNKWKRVVEEATLNVKWFGAIGNGVADDYYAIQRAIDYTIYEDTTIKQVFLPSGNYLISRTLHLGYGSAYSSVTLIGDGTPTFRGEQQYNGATITADFSNAPAINIQGARYTSIKNLTLIGLNDITGFLYDTSSANINNWIDAGLDTIGDNRRTPYAGITIDGYSGTAPTPAYPNVSYPSYTGIGTQYSKIFSSQVKIENVGIHGFIAGVVLQPNSDGNGDFVQIEKCIIDRVAYGISVGNANSRNFAIRDCYIDAHTGLTNSTHGNQTGRFTLIENVHFGGYQWFNINAIAYLEGFEITNCYGESFYWLGTFDGIAGNQPSIKFTSCDFSQTSVGNRNLSNFGKLGGYGSFIFENCSFKGNRIYTFNNADGSWLTFNQCKFAGIAYEGETGDSIEIYHERYFRSFLFLMAAYPDRVRVNQCRFHDTDDITTLSMPQTDGNGITFPDDMEYVTYWKNRDNTGIDINFQDLGHPGYLGISSAFNSYGFTNRLFEGEVKSTYNQGIGPGDLLLFKTDEVLLPVMVTDIDGQDVTGLLMSNYKYNSNGDFTNAFESLTLTSSNVLHISSRKFLNTRTITGDFTSGSRIVTNVRYPYDGTNPANSFEIYTPLLNMNGQLNAAPSPVTTTTYIDSIISSSSFRLSENAARTGTYTIQNCFLGVTDDRTQYLADKEIAFGTGYGIDSDPSFLYDDGTDRMAMGTTDFNRQINLRGGSAAGGILMDTDGTADDDIDPNGVIQFKSVADGGYTQFGTIGFDGYSNGGASPKGQSLTFRLTTTGESSAGYTILYENQLLVNNSSSFTLANNSGRLRIQAGTGGVFSTDTPWLLGGSAYTTVDNNVRLKLAGDNTDTTSSEYGLRVYNGFNQPYFSARNDGNIIIGGRTVSSKLIFLEPTGSGSNFTSIRSGAQSSDYEYIWPIDNPSDGQVLSWNTGGQLSWEDAGGVDVNIYEDDGDVQDGGTTVDVSGNDPIIFNLDASSTETNRMTRYYVDLTSDDLFTYFAQYVTPADSLYITSYDSGIYLNYQGTTASGEGFVISSNTVLDLRADSILMSTVPSKTVLHYITGQYNNTYTKIEGTADGQVLVWDETNGYWEIGTSGDGNGIYDGSGTIPDNTVATLTSNGDFTIDYNGGADGFRIRDDLGAAFMSDKTLSANVGVNSVQASMSFDANTFLINAAYADINVPLRFQSGYLALDASLTPAQITADQNNYAPTGINTANVLRISTDASRSITGLVNAGAHTSGRVLTIVNIGSNDIVLTNEDAASTAANRFLLGANHTLEANQSITVIYDDATDRWRPVHSLGGGGAADGNGIYDGDGTLQAGTTNAVLPANAELRVDYDGGNPGISINDAFNQAYISGQDGTYSVYADNSNAGLVNGGGSWLTGSTYSLVGTASVANTNTVNDRFIIQTNSSGTAAASFGSGILFQGESSTTDNQDMARISAMWTTATHASREAKLSIQLGNNAGALAEIANFNVAGNNAGQLSIGSSSAVTIQNSGITTGTSFTIGNSGNDLILGGASGAVYLGYGTGNAFVLSSGASTSAVSIGPTGANNAGQLDISGSLTATNTSGTRNYMNFTLGFAPTSGTAVHNQLAFSGTINQTGGANGITRGIFLNQTLTAVADFRAIDIEANSSSAKGIYQSGASTTNNFVGNTSFGTTSAPNASALIDMVSTSKGFGAPVMTTAQRDAISSPREGLVVYSSDNDALNLRDGASVWKRLPTTQTVLKTADETVNNSSTYQADDALTFTAKANKKYVGKIKLFITAANWDITAAFKGKITASGATTVRYGGNGGLVSAGTQPTNGYSSDDSVDMIISDGGGFLSGDYAVLDIYFYINPGAGDRTVQFEWAQNAAHTSDLKVLEGSYLEYEEIN